MGGDKGFEVVTDIDRVAGMADRGECHVRVYRIHTKPAAGPDGAGVVDSRIVEGAQCQTAMPSLISALIVTRSPGA
jgi:hypothetical protein